MLFGSIVFMYKKLGTQSITVLIVFLLNLFIVISAQPPRDNAMKFSGDFESFLNDLGSMVYKSKKFTSEHTTQFHYPSTTPPHKSNRRSDSLFNTQKAALRDVLMMKLVSYYEDKYKLAHNEPTTTEGITFMRSFTEPYVSKKKNKYNEVDGADRRYSTPPRNRGVDGRIIRRKYAETAPVVPEVVII